MPAEKPSHGFAIHLRREKEQARREQGYLPFPSWDTVTRTLEQRTYNNDDLRPLYEDNRFVLREFFDARYDIAVGKGSGKLNEFLSRYEQNKRSKKYNPDLIDKLSPLFTIIRDSFPSSRQRR